MYEEGTTMAKTINSKFKMNDGREIPVIGFGTWKADGDTAAMSACEAIKAGYRLLDCASLYRNEAGVGEGIARGIKEAGIKREDLFITSKVWNRMRGYEKTKAAFEKSLTALGLDYMDLYLIHWPAVKKQFENWEEINLDTWRAMTELCKEGKILSIGVANFKEHHLKALMETEIKPAVDQIEFHPGYTQMETVKFCQENGIIVEGWSPLGSGAVLADERLAAIAAKYGKSVAQICLRFAIQNDIVPLPKSVTPSRIVSNLEVFDFELKDEDVAAMAAMPLFGWSGYNSDKVDF